MFMTTPSVPGTETDTWQNSHVCQEKYRGCSFALFHHRHEYAGLAKNVKREKLALEFGTLSPGSLPCNRHAFPAIGRKLLAHAHTLPFMPGLLLPPRDTPPNS